MLKSDHLIYNFLEVCSLSLKIKPPNQKVVNSLDHISYNRYLRMTEIFIAFLKDGNS